MMERLTDEQVKKSTILWFRIMLVTLALACIAMMIGVPMQNHHIAEVKAEQAAQATTTTTTKSTSSVMVEIPDGEWRPIIKGSWRYIPRLHEFEVAFGKANGKTGGVARVDDEVAPGQSMLGPEERVNMLNRSKYEQAFIFTREIRENMTYAMDSYKATKIK